LQLSGVFLSNLDAICDARAQKKKKEQKAQQRNQFLAMQKFTVILNI
jgi:hypothetical protein